MTTSLALVQDSPEQAGHLAAGRHVVSRLSLLPRCLQAESAHRFLLLHLPIWTHLEIEDRPALIMAPRAKRKHDTVDLTGDQDVHMSSQSRHVPPSQVERDSWLEEHEAEDIVMASQDGNDDVTATYQLYSVLDTKIVGVQYYKGIATTGEYVVIMREPGNPYDSNAIRVDNVARNQIGHIPRRQAAKLAKYIDSGALLVEGSLAGK